MTFIKDLLYLINEVGELLPKYKGAYKSLRQMNYPTYYKSLERLEKRGLIKQHQSKQNETVYVISVKGRRLLRKPTKLVRRSDGYSTLVAFDIPESRRRERITFRRYLINNGYTTIQKSLLIAPTIPSEDLLELISELRLNSYIKIISGKIDYLIK